MANRREEMPTLVTTGGEQGKRTRIEMGERDPRHRFSEKLRDFYNRHLAMRHAARVSKSEVPPLVIDWEKSMREGVPIEKTLEHSAKAIAIALKHGAYK